MAYSTNTSHFIPYQGQNLIHFNILVTKSTHDSPFSTYQKPLDGIRVLYYTIPYDLAELVAQIPTSQNADLNNIGTLSHGQW